MTKEELEKEASQYDAEHLRDNGTRWYHNVTVREAYLAGAEPREKRIAELEEKIEKMKCCQNCKHYTSFNDACMIHGYFSYNCDLSEWEMKEND